MPPVHVQLSTISIHALLTESDGNNVNTSRNPTHISIHALLTESDVGFTLSALGMLDFYPRSPYGERPMQIGIMLGSIWNFYPRSPYGERLRQRELHRQDIPISIHALLTESDDTGIQDHGGCLEFLSTLSLRRATLALAL